MHDAAERSFVQGIRIDASASVSRIGGRAYAPAIRELAKSARLDLVQAADAQQFSSNLSEEETAKADRRAKLLNAALQQKPGQPVSIQRQVHVPFSRELKKSLCIVSSTSSTSSVMTGTSMIILLCEVLAFKCLSHARIAHSSVRHQLDRSKPDTLHLLQYCKPILDLAEDLYFHLHQML